MPIGVARAAATLIASEPGLQPVDLPKADPTNVQKAGTEGETSVSLPPPIPFEIPSGNQAQPTLPPPSIPLTQVPPFVPGVPKSPAAFFPAVPPAPPGGFGPPGMVGMPGMSPMAPPVCATCGTEGRLKGQDAVPKFGCPHGGCGAGGCVPGGKPCYQCEGETFIGRFFANLYECLCCPDPCYQPRWIPAANASFFSDYARPRTITRLRWDHVPDLMFPDRSEFFWAQDNGKGNGPKPPAQWPKSGSNHPFHPNVVPIQYKGEQSVLYNQLYMYQEAATARASFFIEYSYRSNDPLLTPHTAGFSDLFLGTKSLLLDCELLQLTFQFKTYLPTGNATKGLGTGHVSLEPSLLASLRLAPETYLQGQLAEWIPIGGDPGYAGAVVHYHASLNHTVAHITPDSPVIATFEFSGYTFQDGAYTDPILGPVKSSGFTYFNLGPGLRMSICNNIDFGAAAAFPLTDPHWGNPQIRTELRFLY